MAVLMLIFLVCATRTNIIYTLIFLSLLLVFLLLSSAYWQLGDGNGGLGDRCIKVHIHSYIIHPLPREMLIPFRFSGSGSLALCR